MSKKDEHPEHPERQHPEHTNRAPKERNMGSMVVTLVVELVVSMS